MVIQAIPVRQPFSGKIHKMDVLEKPFPFMSGAQAVFRSAREALLNGIRLLGYLPKKVHVPAYCCRSVLSPLEKLGLDIRFYDVDEHLEPIMNNRDFNRGDIFLLIHYFGIPQDTLSINQLCQEFGMVLVEDCAHALPDPEVKYPMGSTGSFSIYSLRKLLPVPDGGVLIVNDSQIKARMGGLTLPGLRKMSAKRWLTTTLDRFSFVIGWPNTLVLKDVLRDIIGSSDDDFYRYLSDDSVPEISPVTARMLRQIDIGTVVELRRENYRYMADLLSTIREITIPFPSLPDGAVPQTFPVLIKNAERVCIFMRRKGIGVGLWPWYELPKHISLSDYHGTAYWVKSLMLLPLHQDLSAAQLERIVQILKKNYK